MHISGLNKRFNNIDILKFKLKINSISLIQTGIEVESLIGDIELKEVNFAYPARPDLLVFKISA